MKLRLLKTPSKHLTAQRLRSTQSAAASGLFAVPSSVAGIRERTVRSTAVAELDRPTDTVTMAIRSVSILAAMSIAITSCGDFGKELSIRLKRGQYDAWMATNRPYLLSVPKSSVYRTEFTSMDYGKGDICPIFDFFYKAGDWDGILDVTVILSIDASGAITGIRKERFTFLALPATAPYPSPSDGGRLRHAYHGLHLPVGDIAATLARVAKNEDFDSERKRSHQEGKIVMSCFVDTDDWRSLRSGVAPEASKPKVGDAPNDRRMLIPAP